MTVNDYYKKLNSETTRIFDESLKENNIQSNTHDLISNLQIWYNLLKNNESSIMLLNAIEELDISCLQMMQGLYRGSFASIRLSLEMLCGSVYFSAHNIEYKEWSNGNRDLMWSYLFCPENGILSKRFTDAYYPELKDISAEFHERIKKLYRELSEMVHGNNKTWDYENPSLTHNVSLRSNYKLCIESYTVISNYILCLRFLKNLSSEDISKIEPHIIDCLGYNEEIRTKIGGQI
jgi:hypothetical protein